jgi:uncharacterized RDD family membrane protein YckC
MQPPEEVHIATPEQIELALEPAGLGSRFVAVAVDLLIEGVFLFALALLAGVILGLLGAGSGITEASPLLIAIIVAAVFLFIFCYDIYFEVRHNGQTPGKKMCGLRVIRDTGAPIDFRSSCIRNLLRSADLLPVFYVLGATLILLTRRHQRLGDLAAGALVIRERVSEVPADVTEAIDEFVDERITFTPEQIQACTPADRHILRSFFIRYREMTPDARNRLACRLAKTLFQRTGYEPFWTASDPEWAETFLASLYRSLDDWAHHGRK